MKKQISIIATTFITVAFLSCSKEKIETLQPNNGEEIATAKGGGSGSISNNLNKNLEGMFLFNGNLNDATGKLKPAEASTVGADIYTEDRHGNTNSAIRFAGRYGLTIYNVITSTNVSVAAWVKYDSSNTSLHAFLYGQLGFMQENDKYWGYVNTTTTTGAQGPSVDDHWHHLVTTYDGFFMRFYVDGQFVADYPNQGNFNQGTPGDGATFFIAFGIANGQDWWHGSMDDLRFYNRTLSAQDVQKLYNL